MKPLITIVKPCYFYLKPNHPLNHGMKPLINLVILDKGESPTNQPIGSMFLYITLGSGYEIELLVMMKDL
jgi:hypothetical protein